MTDAVYTEQVILELIDKTGASMDAITARFKAQSSEIKAAATEAMSGGSDALAARTADMNTFWDFYTRRVRMAAATEKEAADEELAIAKALHQYRKAMADEEASEAKLRRLDGMVMARYQRQQEEAAAREALALSKAATAEELDIAKALHQYRQEAAREELEIAKALNRYRIDGAAEVAAAVKVEAAEELEIARELHRYRLETLAIEVAATKTATAEELLIAKELHRYRMEAAAEERVAGKGSGAAGGLARGLGAPGGGVAAAAGLVVGFTLVEQIEQAEKFDKALHDMGTLLADASMPTAAFNELLKETGHMATEVSERFNLDVLQVIKGYKEALSSGWDASELKDMGEAAGTMARAIHSSFDDAASIMSTYRFSQHLTAQETEKEVGDAVFNLINIAKKLDVGEFQRSLGGLLIVAHAAGQDFKDVGAGMTVLTNQGMTTAQAATSLTNVFVRLSTMSGKVKEEFMGMSRAAGLNDDVWDTHKHHLSEIMATVEKVTAGSPELIKKLFPDQRMLRGSEAMAQNLNALGKAYIDMGEHATVGMAAQRSMDNAFDRVEANWKRITNAAKEALVTTAEYWIGGKKLDPADRKPGEDRAEDNYARYGNLYASDQLMDWHRTGKQHGEDNSGNLDKEFARRIREEEGFAARVKAVGDYQTKLEFTAKKSADEHERSAKALEEQKEAAEKSAKAAAEEFETRKATEALTKKMGKPGKGDALHVAGGWLRSATESALGAAGLPDIAQIETAFGHMRKLGKEHAKEQKEIEREVSAALVTELNAREEELKKFNTKKLEDIKKAKDEEARIDKQMADMETRLNEEVFDTKMKQKGGSGKHLDADAQARFARTQLEEIEQKLRDASGPRSKVSENDFKNMIGEYEKISRAKEGAMDRAGNGDRGVRQRLDEESTEQGFIGAFRKMNHTNATSQVDGINGRVFKGKSEAELAKEAAKKVEEKHITQLEAKIDLNVVGITTDSLQSIIKTTVTKVIADIASRGTGVTGRPSLDRGTVQGYVSSDNAGSAP